ncbi:MAG: hypothetical protein KJ787_12505 [Gammaproteobacteria bacterium]|nr:hypothetical protein [Gammaproteobacteria bacterium]MBU1647145.1 hypothetical protein [Gammaproteobacteria bacterium]MBU1972657.1 hypothetical protein [Gammaproteobacteria bacterium]
MQRLLWVLWPSFIVAGVAEALFFTLINPQELYLFGEPVNFSTIATYSVGFLGFWSICAASSLFTCFLQRTPGEINGGGCGHPPASPAGNKTA